MPDWPAIARLLAAEGIAIENSPAPVAVGGGDISSAWRVTCSGRKLFLKTGSAEAAGMFDSERDALVELAAAGTVKVPSVLGHGGDGNVSMLALEWLELERADAACNRLFGRQLAALHRVTAPQHGWHRDNYIGRTPQSNSQRESWPDFFREQRLGYQLELAASRGYRGELQTAGEWLLGNLDALFAGYEPLPSLLHGDLWGGNWAACNGQPVMFDPACYYGDRETDIAMTRLFGGFGRDFYAGYEQAWPLDRGARQREPLYQLYHVLNHLNLFGGGYLSQALTLMKTLRHSL